MKEEALKLADELETDANKILDDLFKSSGEAGSFLWNIKVKAVEEKKEASAMIRRLVEELDKQEHCCPDCGCHFVGEYPFNNAPQTKPLSDEEIEECYWGDGYPDNPRHPKEFARAIEERHGIK